MATSPSSYLNAPSVAHEPSRLMGSPTCWRYRLISYLKHVHVLETTLVGAALFIGLLSLHYAIGKAISIVHISVIFGAAIGAFVYLRRVMRLSVLIALPATLFFLCHPLSVSRLSPSAEPTESLPLWLAPWLLFLAQLCIKSLRYGAIVGWAAVLGLLFGFCIPIWQMLTITLIVCLALESVLIEKAGSHVDRLRRLGISVIIAVGVGITTAEVTSRFISPSNQSLIEKPLSIIKAPLAWGDRDGILSSRLGRGAEDLIADGGRHYLGISVIALCLIAVWSSQRDDRTLRSAAIIAMAVFFSWLVLGQNLHEQLQRMFEFATVKRYVESSTLHLLGMMSLALIALGFVVFFSVATLASGGRRWNFAGVLLAATAVMTWWRTSPPYSTLTFLSSSDSALCMSILQSLTAFLLTCGAAVGVQCILQKNLSARARLLTSAIVLTFLAVDIFPYAQEAWYRSNEVRLVQ